MALTALARIILAEAEAIEAHYAATGMSAPSVHDVFWAGPLKGNPQCQESSRVLVAAASQLIATVANPQDLLLREITSVYSTVILDFVTRHRIADILVQCGQEGLDTEALARIAGLADSTKLARVMRYLATRNIFREVRPDVFGINRVASALAKPRARGPGVQCATGHPGLESFISHCSQEVLQGAGHLAQFFETPPGHMGPTPFETTFARTLPDFMTDPSNHSISRKIGLVMANDLMAAPYSSTVYIQALRSLNLQTGQLIVEVGGGSGRVILSLVNDFPDLRFIVQDLPDIIERSTRPYWTSVRPDLIELDTVTLQGHNYLQAQLNMDAACFIFRHTLYFWSREKVIEILKHLRAAAIPGTTRLLCFEVVTPYACHDNGRFSIATNPPRTPEDVLSSNGWGAGFQSMLDMYMMQQLDSQVRTIADFEEVGLSSGWMLDSVVPNGPISTLVFSTV